MLDNQWWTTWHDLFVKQFIYIAVDYKFISIFSFLFGVGFILFLQNTEKKGRSGFKLFIRRLVVLLLFGVLHGYLIWFGDILLTYAILGFPLLAFYRRRLNTLLYTAIGLLLIPAIWVAAHTFTPELVPWGLPLGPVTDEANRLLLSSSTEVYKGRTYEEMFHQRLVDLSHLQNSSLLTVPLTFAMFLLGAYGWQKGWLPRAGDSFSSDSKDLVVEWGHWTFISSIPIMVVLYSRYIPKRI